VKVNPSNFVNIGVGALNHEVTLPVNTPSEPNAAAKVLPPSAAAAASPELARAPQNDGFEPAQINVHNYVQHRQTKVIFDPVFV